jgi:hypothetical protein
MVVTQAANQWLKTIMAEGQGLINRSLTICHYTSFWRILIANCNGSRLTGSEIADLLRLFAENGLAAGGIDFAGAGDVLHFGPYFVDSLGNRGADVYLVLGCANPGKLPFMASDYRFGGHRWRHGCLHKY